MTINTYIENFDEESFSKNRHFEENGDFKDITLHRCFDYSSVPLGETV